MQALENQAEHLPKLEWGHLVKGKVSNVSNFRKMHYLRIVLILKCYISIGQIT